MAATIQRYYRPIGEVWEILKPRARMSVHPFEFTTYEENERVLKSLTSLDRDSWAKAYSDVARPYEERAEEAEAKGDRQAAMENYLHAHALYRMARFPTTNSPGKMQAYRKSVQAFLKAAGYFEPPLERVEIPFRGKPGEGDRIVGYLRRPKAAAPMPILVTWGGIDGYKEERKGSTDLFLRGGIATLAVDGPGVGECPLKGSEDAERLWDPIFDWIAAHPEFDARRVAVWGASTGGYWAAKLAHTHRDRISAAVDHGGCAHNAFQPDWIEKGQHGEYAYELAETLAYAFGRNSFEEWVEYAPKLSLLSQGILDQPCAPLLVVNGLNDSTFPISDSYILLEHGDPKSARFYPVGHMGITADTMPMILKWVTRTIGVEAP